MKTVQGLFIVMALATPALGQVPERLALADVIADALKANPEIAAAEQRYAAARQRPAQEGSLPDPIVTAGYNSSGNPLPGAGLGTEPTANIGFMVSQQLPYSTKRKLRGTLAERDANAVAQEIASARLKITSRVKQAYYRLAYTYDAGDVLARNKALLDTLLKVSEGRYAVGQAAQQDVIKAQTQLSILELQLQRLEQQRATRMGELNALLNRPPASPLGRPDDLTLVPFDVTLDALVAAAMAHAPMLERDRIMIDRSLMAVTAAQKEYKPDIGTRGHIVSGPCRRADGRPVIRRVAVAREAGTDRPHHRHDGTGSRRSDRSVVVLAGVASAGGSARAGRGRRENAAPTWKFSVERYALGARHWSSFRIGIDSHHDRVLVQV